MTQKVVTISKNEPVKSASIIMINGRANSVIVLDGQKPVGILTESDFLKRIYGKKGIENLKVMDVMSAPLLTMQEGSSLAEAIKFFLDRKIRKLPVLKKGRLAGIITMTDILRFLNDNLKSSSPNEPSVPLVADAMKQDFCAVDSKAKISDIIRVMAEKDTGCVLVHPSDAPRALLDPEHAGIITSKDLLYEFYKNPDSLTTLRSLHIMKTPLECLSPFLNIFEANTHMLYKKFRRMPVVHNKSISGLVTQYEVLKSFYNYFREQSKQK
jgi:predicted transcriptional regulator